MRLMTSAPVYQAVLKRLGAVAVALGATNPSAAEVLSSIPLDVAKTLASADELEQVDDEDRVSLFAVLANDRRPGLRALIAERLSTCRVLDEQTEGLLDRLSLDPDLRVRRCLTRAVARLLPRVSGLDRTELVGRWATSLHTRQRLIAAQVLIHRFPVLWEDVIVEHLTRDPVPAVRRAAWRAAEARGLAAYLSRARPALSS